MYYACDEHIELALDVVVDENEVFPVMEKLTQEQALSTTCSFCEKQAIYSVTK
ncbi:CxxH/CxxC protein [Alkalicoccobacillus plakortidis]|uniref:CxxH/CxxC protein n=1 Tax=Alkalicoccobacillus plakortidis TaxID=444060 RepID=A0ABT0XL33_9BACI|nr:CxxH/CxxC protein [Alkalicoccobacillus plakortidis]MCM2676420.1 CxxH/CxxC protein [Alkalicoccobacillus plakortidis]